MTAFVDSSALYALLDQVDPRHGDARDALPGLRSEGFVTHNYVLLETITLVQARLGIGAVVTLARDLLPLVEVDWVDRALHEEAVAAVMATRRRELSLVDQVSFAVMRRRGLTTAFAFDEAFRRQGFRTVPD